ncbi:MAG: lipid II flippase MurJ [Oscillochloridaceae bacterium umkhey_bin13]
MRVALSQLVVLERIRRTPVRQWPTLEFSVSEAAAIYMAGFMVSAGLGVIRQIMLNARFGLGPEAAAYYAAARLPETVAILIAGGALTNALVPVLLRVHARDGEAAALNLVNTVLTSLLLVLAPILLLAALFAPQFVQLVLAPGFTPDLQALTTTLARIMLLEVVLLVCEAALAAILISRNQVLLPVLAIAARNLAMIGGIAVALLIPSVGIYGPTVGSILDALLQLAILTPGLRQRGYRPRLAWQPTNPDVRTTWRLLWPNALGGASSYAAGIADTAFATLSGVTAAVGAITNAWMLAGLPIRLLGVAIGQAALPHLADLGTSGAVATMRTELRRILVRAALLAVLTSVALFVIAESLVRLLFQRGAFDAEATALTAHLMRIYLLGLPAYVLTEVATRALVARFDTLSAMLANMAQLGLRIALMILLLEPLGPAAIPSAFALSAVAETCALLLVLHWRVHHPRGV